MRVVQLRMTVIEDPTGTLIRVDGWLGGEGLAEFEGVMNTAVAPVRLFVGDLRGADAAGLSLLRRLADAGTPMEGLSPYLKLSIAGPAPLGPEGSSSLPHSRAPVP